MKICVAGGSGFVGRVLIQQLLDEGHQVILLSRSAAAGNAVDANVSVEVWDGKTVGNWSQSVRNCDAIINLCGAGVADKRWSVKRKEELRSSRLDSTRVLVDVIQAPGSNVSKLINASAIGIYPNDKEGCFRETDAKGHHFLSHLCDDWEKAALKAQSKRCQVTCLRIGLVLGQGGGLLSKMSLPFKLFMGGPLGSGKQMMPWIHVEDLARLAIFCLHKKNVEGPINAVAPYPVSMRDFCNSYAKSIGRPSWLPVPGFVISMALGELADSILNSPAISAEKILDLGFQFNYPDLEGALINL